MSTPQEAFDALLAWFNPDRDIAAQQYETIRAGLIRIFAAKGFSDAEDLADETIDRVIKRLPDIKDSYVGDRARYFHGVSRFVIKEAIRRKEVTIEVTPVAVIRITNESVEFVCLRRCLQFLAQEKGELILDYHVYEGEDKVEQHEIMAQELGISKGALRNRTHQIRVTLEECVLKCSQGLSRETKAIPGSIVNSGSGTRSVNHGRSRNT